MQRHTFASLCSKYNDIIVVPNDAMHDMLSERDKLWNFWTNNEILHAANGKDKKISKNYNKCCFPRNFEIEVSCTWQEIKRRPHMYIFKNFIFKCVTFEAREIPTTKSLIKMTLN